MRFRLIKFVPTMITRKTSAGSYVNGKWVEGASETLERNIKVQPLRPLELQAFPESDRNKGLVQVFCQEADLRATQQGVGGWQADEFTWGGYVYEIYQVEWHDPSACIPHGRYIAARKEVTPN